MKLNKKKEIKHFKKKEYNLHLKDEIKKRKIKYNKTKSKTQQKRIIKFNKIKTRKR